MAGSPDVPSAEIRPAKARWAGWLDRDGWTILLEKSVRTVPYGFLGVLFGYYLAELGFDGFAVGAVVALTVLTSALYTFASSLVADRIGRRRTLAFFALMDTLAGALLLSSTAWWAPVMAGVVGNMSVGAGEVGPFLSLEQAILPRTCTAERRTLAFSVYNLFGYGASAVGALVARVPDYLNLQPHVLGYRPLFFAYMMTGLMGAVLYSALTKDVELGRRAGPTRPLSPRGRPIVVRLAALFSLDAFGGGFIGQSILSYYFSVRYGLDLSSLGTIFFATQIVTALSFLLAARIARRIGLLRTMVFSHIPSNLFLIGVALAPTSLSAVALLLCRQSLSQMDVPTRQSYTMAIVEESDRTAAAGLTSSARTVSSSVSPSLAGYAIQNLWIGTPVFLAGALKLVYDGLIYGVFRKVKPPEEAAAGAKR